MTDKPVMAGPSGMKKIGDSDVMDDECGGTEDTNELIRHGGKFPPPIDTGGNGASHIHIELHMYFLPTYSIKVTIHLNC